MGANGGERRALSIGLFGIDWSPVKPPANHDPRAIQLALEARVRRVADAGAEEKEP